MSSLRSGLRIARVLITAFALIALAILASFSKAQPALAAGADLVPAASGDTVTVEVSGVYGQTEARSMLKMVNDFRTGREIDGGQTAVWALDASSPKDSILGNGGIVNTADYVGLSELEYDYELEKTAMQRAMEMILKFSHTRPDGTMCFTAFPSGYTAQGENIAAGQGQLLTAREAFDGWCETYCPYDYNADYESQGHRRNMLSRSFNRIGIASVSVTYKQGNRQYDLHYWVQEFGYRSDDFGTTQTTASDGVATANIDVLRNSIESFGVSSGTTSLSLTYGEANELNDLATTMRLSDTWPKYYRTTVIDSYTLTSANPSIASVSGKTITANKVGTTTLTATSALDSSATAEIAVTVEPRSLSEATVELPAGDYTYTGAAQTPIPTVTLDGTTLIANSDYSVAYKNNENAGTATVTITGTGNYKDSASTTFEIGRKDIDASDVSVDEISSVTYNGAAQTPAVVVKRGDATLAADTDYSVAYSENINAGTAVATITGTGNYSGERTVNFTIDPSAIGEPMVVLNQESFEYNGGIQVPGVTVKMDPEAFGDDVATLVEGKDYTVATSENTINCGTYEVTVTGKGNYNGVVTKQYAIVQKPIEASMIELDVDSKTYNRQTQAPAVKVMNGDVELTGADCTITNHGGVDVGTYQVKVVAVNDGNYTGEASKNFSISAKDIADNDIEVTEQAAEFTGSEIAPVAQVKFGEVELGGADMAITCDQSCVNADTYTISISGQGNFTGTREAHFTVNPKQLADEMVRLDVSSFVFNGSVQVPSVTVADGDDNPLTNNDFEMAIDQAIDSGTYYVKVTGKRNYASEITKSFEIAPKSLTEEMVTLDCNSFEYSGSAQVPQVTVSDGDALTADDYSTVVDNAVNRGTYSVKVTAGHNYTGEVVKTFDITPKQLTDDMVILDPAESEYDGSLQAPAVKVMNGDIELTEADCTITNDGGVDAGTYNVKVAAVDGGNYTGEAHAQFTIKMPQWAIVAEQLNALSDLVTATELSSEQRESIEAARAAFNDLNDDERNKVGNAVDNLTNAEDRRDVIDAKAEADADAQTANTSREEAETAQRDYESAVEKANQAAQELKEAQERGASAQEIAELSRKVADARKTAQEKAVAASDSAKKASDDANTAKDSAAHLVDVMNGSSTATADEKNSAEQAKKDAESLASTASDRVNKANEAVQTATTASEQAESVAKDAKKAYEQERAKSSNISRASIGAVKARTYTGAAMTPSPVVKLDGKTLSKGADYKLSYAKNVNVGTATITVKGIGNYTGSKSVTFKINKASIAKAKFAKIKAQKLKKKGKAVKPKVKVKFNGKKLKANVDYTVKYKKSKKKGKAKAIVIGKGNFSGKKTIKFKIK